MVGGLARNRANDITIFALAPAAPAVREIAPRATIRTIAWSPDGASVEEHLDPAMHDVLLCPQMGLGPPNPGLPAAVAVPDLIPLLVPECFEARVRDQREALVAHTMARAQVVFTGSQHSRRAILDAYPIEAENVILTPCDVAGEFRNAPIGPRPELARELELRDGYMLFPANYWPHKNHENVLRAMSLLARAGTDITLLLTGAESSGASRVRALIDQLDLHQQVRMLPYQATPDLVALMREARAVLYPTRMEGFGIPPLEAFHLGVPVIASGAGGSSEVIGDAALLVDPDSPQSIAVGIERVLRDSALRAELCRRGTARIPAFSWSRTVITVQSALERIARPAPAYAGAGSGTSSSG